MQKPRNGYVDVMNKRHKRKIIMKDRRKKRPKDHKNHWMREAESQQKGIY